MAAKRCLTELQLSTASQRIRQKTKIIANRLCCRNLKVRKKETQCLKVLQKVRPWADMVYT